MGLKERDPGEAFLTLDPTLDPDPIPNLNRNTSARRNANHVVVVGVAGQPAVEEGPGEVIHSILVRGAG